MGWDLIGSAQASLENAIDASKVLRERVESKNENLDEVLHRLRDVLVETKTALAGAREERAKLYDEIRSLSESLRVHGSVVKHLDAYYLKSADGQGLGDPYCLACWELHHMLFHLMRKEDNLTLCCNCHSDYSAQYTPFQVAG